jgi:hypothetical protein
VRGATFEAAPAPAVAEPQPAAERARTIAERSPRRPLDPSLRRSVEGAYGASLGDVGVRTGPDAERAARMVWARAFAFERDIVFGADAFRPETADGRTLIAHELAHVVQQTGARRVAPGVSRAGDRFERHAELAARGAMAGQPVPMLASLPGGAPAALSRAPDDGPSLADRQARDEIDATMIDLTAAFDDVQPTTALVDRAQELEGKFEAEDRPLTRVAAAKRLRGIAKTLHEREKSAPKDPNGGALMETGIDGTEQPWLPGKPKSVADIAPFTANNELAWETVASQAEKPKGKAGAKGKRAPATPPPAVRQVSEQEAIDWAAASAGRVAEQTEAEKRAGTERFGGQDVAKGLADLRGTTAAQAAAAVQRGTADAPPKDSQVKAEEKSVTPVGPASTLLELSGEIWYVNRRLYAVNRAGQIETADWDDFAFDLYGSSIVPGTYYFGPFAVGIRGSKPYYTSFLVRVDGGARMGSGDIFAARVLTSLLPMLERGQKQIKAGHGVGIIISPHIKEKSPDADSSRLLSAMSAATKHLPWAISERLHQVYEHPIQELVNVAMGIGMQRVAAAVPIVGEVMLAWQALELARWMGSAADVALRARGDDEIDIAGQAIAKKVADFAVTEALTRGITAGAKFGSKAIKGGGVEPKAPSEHVGTGERESGSGKTTTDAPAQREKPVVEQTKGASEQGKGPTERSKAPADEGRAPRDETKAPHDETKAPADETKAPRDETKTPHEETKAPRGDAKKPADQTQPTDHTKPPSDQTKPPAQATGGKGGGSKPPNTPRRSPGSPGGKRKPVTFTKPDANSTLVREQALRLQQETGLTIRPDQIMEAPWIGRAGSRGTSAGWLRNSRKFRAAWKAANPNEAKLLKGNKVTQAYADAMGWPRSTVGHPLEHHHIGNGPYVVYLPKGWHKGNVHATPTRIDTPTGGFKPNPPLNVPSHIPPAKGGSLPGQVAPKVPGEIIGRRPYAPGALEQMERGKLTPTVVEEAVTNGRRSGPDASGVTTYTHKGNGVKVKVGADGQRLSVERLPRP